MKDNSSVSTAETNPFRVIVVGGGVGGLVASHCLQRANIDHVVLERRSTVAPAEGGSIGMYPQGSRILKQIGCLKPVEDACTDCLHYWLRKPNGKALADIPFWSNIKNNHGKHFFTLERRLFLDILFQGLPDKSYIRTNCHVKNITQDANGVEVSMDDGSVEKGDMVLGVDGVSSLTRTMMWKHADVVQPGLIPETDKTCIQTRWQALIGLGPHEPKLGPNAAHVVHDHKFSFLMITQSDRVFWFVFFRLEKTKVWPERGRYTKAEAEDIAKTIANHPLNEQMKFGELWEHRERGDLIPIEEGVLDVWHHDRIVLAGDAAHKVTPNSAFGGNLAMESVVQICNQLHELMEHQQGAKPSRAALREIFTAYQKERHPRVLAVFKYASLTTKIQAWDSWFLKFVAEWIFPYLPGNFISNRVAELVKAAPKINFLPSESFMGAKVAWEKE